MFTDNAAWRIRQIVAAGRVLNVISLQLDDEGISGGIHNSSSTLFRLLYLAYNDLGGIEIPRGIHNLKHLTHLNLSDAGFVGQVPIEVSLLRRLVSLDLSSYRYGRRLKIENPNLKMLLQNLTGLRELYLDRVNIRAQGNEWCQAISSSLPQLQILSFRFCGLSGPMHHSLSKLHSLSVVQLDGNNMSSVVPNFFANLSSLTTLSLSDCGLKGSFPEMIFQVPTLENLHLSYNELLTGTIPHFHQNASFRTIWLSGTNFSGPLPNSIGNLSMLSQIALSHCSFTGSIPESLFTLERLDTLFLSHNFFNGTIQLEKFQRLHNLIRLDLSYNSLFVDTSISNTSLSTFPQLSELALASCDLHKFPDLINQHNMYELDLSNNQITGEVPNWIWEIGDGALFSLNLSLNLLVGLQKPYHIPILLDVLDLHSNQLQGNNISGRIPDTFFVNCALEILDISQNCLEGSLPASLANCKSLQVLNVGNNNIDDSFPCMLPSSLRVLVLRFNRFHGHVRCRKSWPNLQIIDIASNNFTGYLYPKSFSRMMLEKDAQSRGDYLNYRETFLGSYYQAKLKVVLKGVDLELVKILTIFTAIDFFGNNFQGRYQMQLVNSVVFIFSTYPTMLLPEQSQDH
ncbi:Receptor-like protein 53 [Sesamum alatum]|uniref:Receptor-like protein 53 n=1 Tax=Sesamum alatum TaxID=300844 RepID=A0AAE1XXA3_9LAMI|nr:Receptor-like protein 53 [Sesamum alatum]